jgi:hypothetical protein
MPDPRVGVSPVSVLGTAMPQVDDNGLVSAET